MLTNNDTFCVFADDANTLAFRLAGQIMDRVKTLSGETDDFVTFTAGVGPGNPADHKPWQACIGHFDFVGTHWTMDDADGLTWGEAAALTQEELGALIAPDVADAIEIDIDTQRDNS